MLRARQLRKNLFETEYAHTLLAFRGSLDAPGAAIGMAMYFHNFSTWTGKPGIYVRSAYRSKRVEQLRIPSISLRTSL